MRTVAAVVFCMLGCALGTRVEAQTPTWQEWVFAQVFLGTPGLPNDWQAYLSVTAGPHPTTVTIYVRTEDEPVALPGVDRTQLWYPYSVDVPAGQRISIHINHVFWFRYGRQVQAGGTVKANCSYACTMAIGQHHAAAATEDPETKNRMHWQGAFVLTGERIQ